MTWNGIALQLVEILLPVIGLLLTALIALGVAYLRKQTERISNEIARDSLFAALAEAEKQAINAVKATNQILVDELKEAHADGELTEEERQKALKTAKAIFMDSMSKGALQTLQSAVGPLEKWLTSLIETKVAEVKREQVSKLANPLS